MPKKIKRRPAALAPDRRCLEPVNEAADIAIMRAFRKLALACRPYANQIQIGDEIREPQRSVNVMLVALHNSAERAVHGIDVLLGHGALTAAFVMGRPVFEYMVRAHYCERYPEYAEWAARLQYFRSMLRHKESQMENKEKRLLGDEIRREERRTAHEAPWARKERGLVPFHEITFADMVDELLGDADQDVYRIQSMLLHGDLYAITYVNEVDNKDVNRAYLDAVMEYMSVSVLLQQRSPRNTLNDAEFSAAVETINTLSRRYYGADISETKIAL